MKAYWEKGWALLLALAIPVAAMGSWVANLVVRPPSQTVRVPIEGVDPRDLLAGQYLRYRISVPGGCSAKGVSCACFLPDAPVSVGACEALRCRNYVKGSCSSGGFTAPELERYYFPEALKSRLAALPEGATLQLRVGVGWAEAQQIFVQGVRIEEWAIKSAP